MNVIRDICYRTNWIVSAELGIDASVRLRSLWGLRRYMRDLFRFCVNYTRGIELLLCMHDWSEEDGTTENGYLWQDFPSHIVIFLAVSEKHMDIGSRVDGFVAHVASFRELEVFDVRPIRTQIPGVTFKQADLMKPMEGMGGYCDSLSCLHALEHFGLGRYGDPIDPKGFERGFVNMADLLRRDGVFYLSIPIGIDRVEFNAHRIFNPRSIVNLAAGLSALTVIRQGGRIEALALDEVQLSDLPSQRYALGIFSFVKCAVV